MCWSAKVSLRFALLDTCFVAMLAAKARKENKKPNRHKPSFANIYAGVMVFVTLQEWAQFGIWKRWGDDGGGGEESIKCIEHSDVLLSMLTTGAAEAVPLPMLVASFLGRRTNAPYRNSMRQLAIFLWSMQILLVVLSVVLTNKYCVEEGVNHHQVWICESASYQAGGHFLHYSFFWLYVLSCLCAAESVDRVPLSERRCVQAIGLVTAIVSGFWFGDTLEACSVWCWSAFVLGVYLCAQVYGYVDVVSSFAKEVMSDAFSKHSPFFEEVKNLFSRSRGSRQHGL